MTTEFLQSEELSGLFIDGLVTDSEDNLLFLSAWGNESQVQHIRAQLSLPVWEGQLRHFQLQNPKGLRVDTVRLDRNVLEDITGRPLGNTVFSHLTQLWIYHRLAVTPDNGNHQAVLLRQHSESEKLFKKRVWEAVQVICPVPLHFGWEPFLLDKLVLNHWVTFCRGFQVDACCLNFSDSEVEAFISDQVRTGALTLPSLQ